VGRVGWLITGGAALLLLGAGLFAVLGGRNGGAPAGTPLTTRPVTEAAPADFFTDVTATSGVDFTYRNGQEADHYAILESLGGGVALLDYDGDGLLDLFLTGGGFFDGPDKKEIKGHTCRLYRNLGGWKFQDVTREAGLDGIAFYSHGAAVADYDRDGWPDLLVTGYGRLALFHNVAGDKGGRRFVEVTKEAGLLGPHFWSTSAGWADLDGDGFPDLYVCQYVDWSFANNPPCNGYTADIDRDICPPAQFEARPHALYRNRGDGTFLDVSKEAGLRFPRKPEDYQQLDHLTKEARERLEQTDHDRDYGKGLGVLLADINGDGKPDVYVANDTTDKFLYVNRSGPGKLRFEEQGVPLGVARDDRGVPNGSMGLDAGDYDGSGRPSLLVTNYENESHALYRNMSVGNKPVFRYSSMTAGLTSIGRQYVGFGTGFLDVDGDGWEDIVFANGHVIRHPTRSKVQQAPVLLRNQGRQENSPHVRFTVATAQGGEYFRGQHQARGLAVGDLDNDGKPDLVISHVNAPVTLLRNGAGGGHHWLGVELVGRDHADVVGARVTLEAGGRAQTRFAKGGGSYLSSGDRRLLFGLGDAGAAGRLTVVWPSGEEQHWDGLAVDRYWRLVAGEPAAQETRVAPTARP
jgi:enediyne biosynthesis protein E4